MTCPDCGARANFDPASGTYGCMEHGLAGANYEEPQTYDEEPQDPQQE